VARSQQTGESRPASEGGKGRCRRSKQSSTGISTGNLRADAGRIVLAGRATAMPLACGDTVMPKASDTCPGAHPLIGQVPHDAARVRAMSCWAPWSAMRPPGRSAR